MWGQAFSNSEDYILEPKEFCTDKEIKKVDIGDKITTVVNSAGRVYTWSSNQNEIPLLVPEISTKKVRDIACGDNFWLALG